MKALGKYMNNVFTKVRKCLAYKIDLLKRRVKRYVRGYSTIEMQLIRILAYQKGLKMGKPKTWQDIHLVVNRKIFEYCCRKRFLQILFNIYIYLHTVQTNLNGRVFAPLDKIFGDVDVLEWPMEALFIIVLGLNNMRITRSRVDAYANIINKYQLDVELAYQLVDCIQ